MWQGYDGWGMGMGMGGFGLWHLLWWALLIVAGVVLFRLLLGDRGRNGRTGGEDRALDILRERFARGEIDQQEFEERMRQLKK